MDGGISLLGLLANRLAWSGIAYLPSPQKLNFACDIGIGEGK